MKQRAEIEWNEKINLGLYGLFIRGYGTDGKFVCRIGIGATGLDLYKGKTGKKRVCSVSWEELVDKLDKKGK